jgi:hypothetical protein
LNAKIKDVEHVSHRPRDWLEKKTLIPRQIRPESLPSDHMVKESPLKLSVVLRIIKFWRLKWPSAKWEPSFRTDEKLLPIKIRGVNCDPQNG